MIRATVSVVSTGERAKLRPCLLSLSQQTISAHMAVTLVCNGGDDGSGALARELLPTATVLVRDGRHGFAENHNYALARGAGHRVVLNPDVVLDERCVEVLADFLDAHADCGVVGPLMTYPSGEPQPSARRFPAPRGTLLRRTPLRALFPRATYGGGHFLAAPTAARTVDWVLGACVAIGAAAWDAIGGLDPGFRPLYVEDVDLCWRVWEAGWSVWQTPEARAVHEHQAATDKLFWDRRTLWHARGMLHFVRRHPAVLLGRGPRRRTEPGSAAPAVV